MTKERIRLLVLSFLLLVQLVPTTRGEQSAPAIARAVVRVGMTVSDIDRSLDFYTNVLAFQKTSETEVVGRELESLTGVFGARARLARLTLGREEIELIEFLAPRGRRVPVESRSNDRWFQHVAIITSDMDGAYRRLRSHKVRHASTGPQTLPAWNKSAGGIRAFYFKDPDDHVLEILQFPPGKGDAKWQATDSLFLGIDHTAIVVADTDASLRFYRDALGLRVTGESENWGEEQERLNNVFGARLRITTLKASAGPGIELLEYLTPRDGKPHPRDSKVNDLWHWHTTIAAAPSLGTASTALRAANAIFVSPGIASVPSLATGMMLRDPDGHALLLTE